MSPPFNRHTSLGYIVNRAGRLFARALEQRLSDLGVPLGQFPILLVLWEQEGLTQTEISRRLDIEQPTVANTLKRMMRDDMVVATPDATNRRRVLIFPTDKARDLQPALTAAAQEVNAQAGRGITPQEFEMFLSIMARMMEELVRSGQLSGLHT